MFVGTVMGVLVIPGLYYLFARFSDGRRLLRTEVDEPLSEMFERGELAPDRDGDGEGDRLPTAAAAAAVSPGLLPNGAGAGPAAGLGPEPSPGRAGS